MTIRNTRTGKTTDACDGKDAAHILRVESDRRTGIELSKRGGEVYAETDPENWPDGRPTFGCGR